MKQLIVFTCIFFMGCGGNDSADNNAKDTALTDTAGSTTSTAEPAVEHNCYMMIFKKDTANMQLEISGTVVKGSLQYSLHEKDSNKGTLQGTRHDSLLIADYTFNSEGISSVRQVVFKINGDTLTEGYGGVNVKGDTVKFKNIDKLRFMNNRPFVKTDCK